MRLLLHVGSTKTGSSALQAVLYERHEALLAAGVLYSRTATAMSALSGAHHLLAAAVHPNAWRMHRDEVPEDRAAYVRETARGMIREAKAAGCETVVVSSEYLWAVFQPHIYAQVREAFEDVDIEIVGYIRRPDHWAVSSYLQAVKSGESRDFEPWLEGMMKRLGGGLYAFPILNHWHVRTQARRTHLLRYEGETRRNVFRAFCEAAGIEGIDTEDAPGRVNPSPDREGVPRLLEVNRRTDLTADEKRQERLRVLRETLSAGLREPFTIPDRIRLQILEATATSNRNIRRHLCADLPPRIFAEPWPADERTDEPASGGHGGEPAELPAGHSSPPEATAVRTGPAR